MNKIKKAIVLCIIIILVLVLVLTIIILNAKQNDLKNPDEYENHEIGHEAMEDNRFYKSI